METLTESIVKQVALRFFRHHYKFRLRHEDQPVEAKYDMEGAGGILADGYYRIKNPDGKPFTATFEATSRATRDEVTYKPQKKILSWDGLAVASVAAAFVFALNHVWQLHALDERTYLQRAGIFAGVVALTFAVFWFAARRFRRYRYIYAVEQFKKYHADEQWVALAHDVFDDGQKKDRHLFRELKEQCVFNGFGLLVVDKNLDPKIIITPARQDIFLGRRRLVEFFGKNRSLAQAGKSTSLEPWRGMFGTPQLGGVLKKDTSVLRHRKTFYHQMAVAAASFGLIGLIVLRELKNADFQRVERQELLSGKKPGEREQPEFLGDSTSKPERKPSKKDYWQHESEEVAEAKPPVPDEFNTRSGEVLTPKSGGEFTYDCARYYNVEGKTYIVEGGVYPSWDQAKQRIEALRRDSVEAAALLLACFSKTESGLVVYAGMIFSTEEEAREKMKELGGGDWKIRALEPIRE